MRQIVIGGDLFPTTLFAGRYRRVTAARNVLSNAVANHDSKNEAEDQGK